MPRASCGRSSSTTAGRREAGIHDRAGRARAHARDSHAGDYSVHSCKAEAGAPVHPTDGWKAIGSVNAETVGNECFRGRTLFGRLPVADYVSGALVGWRFDAPAGTEIVNYRISRSVVVGKPSAGGAAPAYYLTWPTPTPGDIREQCVQPACSSLGRRDRPVPENIVTPAGPMAGVSALHLLVGCGGPAGAKCLASDTAPGTDPVRLDIHAAQITLRDQSPPALAAISGPLTAPSRTESGVTTVTVRATDTGGGVAAFTLEVDGKAVATAAAPGCQAAPYTMPAPVPATRRRPSRSTRTRSATATTPRGSWPRTWAAAPPRPRRSRCASTTAPVPPSAPRSASTIAAGQAELASRG